MNDFSRDHTTKCTRCNKGSVKCDFCYLIWIGHNQECCISSMFGVFLALVIFTIHYFLVLPLNRLTRKYTYFTYDIHTLEEGGSDSGEMMGAGRLGPLPPRAKPPPDNNNPRTSPPPISRRASPPRTSPPPANNFCESSDHSFSKLVGHAHPSRSEEHT